VTLYVLHDAPAAPPEGWPKGQHWPPSWLHLANHEAMDHFMLIAEVGDRWCIYCGEVAEEADHLVPKPISGTLVRRWVPTVPSCQSCNRTLRDFPVPIVAARAAHVALQLRRRHKVRTVEELEQSPIPDEWTLLLRLYHLEWGGLLRAIRDNYMPMPNLDHAAAGRV